MFRHAAKPVPPLLPKPLECFRRKEGLRSNRKPPAHAHAEALKQQRRKECPRNGEGDQKHDRCASKPFHNSSFEKGRMKQSEAPG